MKKIITIYIIILMTASLFAQSPNKMSYQAVIRNSSNTLVTNSAVGMRISILQTSPTGKAVYVETQTPTTNANGLASIEIGGGTVVTGNFSTIDWANGTYFVKTETDPAGGTNYSITGTSQLLSVPYALYAKSAGSVGSGTSNLILPTITTNAITGITSNSATFGGAISDANGNQIMERGVVYSTTPNPWLGSPKIVIGSGIGTFDIISDIGHNYPHLLNSNTTYYVRAYAVTENNITVYGNEVSFTTLTVGQKGPGNGIVFFNKGNTNGGWQYLEAAPSDQSKGTAWGCQGTSIPGTQLTVGSGKENTSLIVAGCNDTSFPAKLCDNLTLGGQSDWFLPSRDELNLMYKNLHLNNEGNFYTSNYYWSSTEQGPFYACYFHFGLGTADKILKSHFTLYVRAIRAF